MPTPLNVSVTLNWDTTELQPWAPTVAGRKGWADKRGFRWVLGDRKDQVLVYSSTIFRGEFVRRGPLHTGSYGYFPDFYGQYPYSGNGWLSTPPAHGVKSWNRAYQKFKDEIVGESSQIGTFAAERKEAFGMVANRVIGLRNAYKALRRGDFRQFLKMLSVDPKRKHRSKLRSAASEASGLWLEYWFGWSPTVNDLFLLSEVLAHKPISQPYHAASKTTLPDAVGSASNTSSFMEITESGFYICKTGAKVRVINPDELILQQMGLLNPLSIAWEVVPFSFVVDWFTKFGDVISTCTDFAGLELTDAYTTQFQKTTAKFRTGRRREPRYDHSSDYMYRLIRSTRSKGLAQPLLVYPRLSNFGQSQTRAATAVSLLIQLFLAK